MSLGEFANCGCAICTGDFYADDVTQGSGGTSPANAPTFNNDQVINQIDSGYSWSGSTINFGFLTGDPGWTQGEGSGLVQFTSAQKAATREILEMFDDIVAPDIVETGGNPADADINFANTSTSISYAHAYYPSTFWDIGGSVWLNAPGYGSLYNPQEGNYAYLTIIHEIGHAMGLSHPGAYNGGSPSYSTHAEYAQDTHQYSVMSYFNASNTGADHNGGTGWKYPQTLMVHDILTLHSIYGADTDTRNTDTTYGFNTTESGSVFDFSSNQTPVLSIYDAGGIDTLDLSGFSQRAIVDLTPGAYSSVGGVSNTMTYNVGIAYETWIENAKGGSGNDTITGNSLNNILEGGSGNDILNGGDGNDRLVGDDGADQLNGGAGDDVLVVDASDTSIQGGADFDRVIFVGSESFNFTLLGTGIEDVRSGSGNDNINATGVTSDVFLFGNGGVDTITGGTGNDYINGGAANDIISGGDGDDNLLGANGNDTLNGNDGNDRLVGHANDDTLNGGIGNDRLIGGSGSDNLFGGEGDDVLVVDVWDTVANGGTIDGGAGFDRVILQGNDDFDFSLAGTGIEDVRSKGGNDTLDATGVGNAVMLFGNAGNDTITGGAYHDYLSGGDGNDIIEGGNGKDTMFGGSGSDRFVFNGNTAWDTIRDWEDGVDLIDFSSNIDIASMADLTITSVGSHAHIGHNGNTIVVINAAGQIDSTDFDFA